MAENVVVVIGSFCLVGVVVDVPARMVGIKDEMRSLILTSGRNAAALSGPHLLGMHGRCGMRASFAPVMKHNGRGC